MAKKITKQIHYREVEKGQYVSEQYAKKHPDTTVKETDNKKSR